MSQNICADGESSIMYAWAKQAPGLTFPKGVGLKIGGSSKINYAVMQVHFHDTPHDKADYPHLKLKLTTTHQPKVAAIYLLNGFIGSLPPHKQNIEVPVACKFEGPNVIYPIGFRTHAHSLSPLIAGFLYSHSSKKWSLIGHHSPQEPQAFYPSQPGIEVHPGDILAARCHYNTSQKSSSVYFGPESSNEMCNFYIMFYTDNNGRKISDPVCYETPDFKLPSLSDFITQEENTSSTDTHNEDSNQETTPTVTTPAPSTPPTHKPSAIITLAKDWRMNYLNSSSSINGLLGVQFGQVTGIDVDSNDLVYMFHRGNHVWDFNSFTVSDYYNEREKGPITESVILVTDPNGTVITKWGKDIFYLPHGLSIDPDDTLWMTDVARHQIFKLSSIKNERPLALGAAFHPGSDKKHFCKPAAVLFDPERGRIYVADGYCNHRILVFSKKGSYITQYSNKVDGLQLEVPHSLALSSDGETLYVADRENYRIIEYNTLTGSGSVFVSSDKLGGAIYAISFADKARNWPMYAINGSMDERLRSVGFTINEEGNVVDTWYPHLNEKGFTQPHDIAVNVNGSAIYVAEIGPNKVWKFDVHESSFPPPSSFMTTPSCVPSSSPLEEDTYLCPRPPPPPISLNTTATGGTASQYTPSVVLSDPSLPSQTSDQTQSTSGSTKSSISVLPVAILVIIMLMILSLILLLVGFVAIRKKRSSLNRPLFKVRRHYSRHPKKRMDVLLQATGSGGKKGFTQLKTFDSESEEEFTVFQKT
ncbi:PREDICTED: peptidyl-glycine alpha-amidating monooxygenase-like [Amphimedon queenslandica]|uniref:Peptidylamidoglycolate lyase n=1 Tax=Amphimedon queenslandica TaxID=400682 RepID=A0A1X7U6T2_AMPQE|nr:PREDICTED: peptidyl-glycine alpha-amidating monooxygenase-like [Amphimedon queenslandica]|eukprot:XP_003388865.3 PREDICTED: peptidyl-glycine alpha-amidating monooxygenase-like [Amphimedon queenslandica]